MADETKTEWRLQSIKIEYQQWGELKGSYLGKIAFENGEAESFSFKIRPDMAADYIKLMSNEIVRSASELGPRLIESLNLPKVTP